MTAKWEGMASHVSEFAPEEERWHVVHGTVRLLDGLEKAALESKLRHIVGAIEKRVA